MSTRDRSGDAVETSSSLALGLEQSERAYPWRPPRVIQSFNVHSNIVWTSGTVPLDWQTHSGVLVGRRTVLQLYTLSRILQETWEFTQSACALGTWRWRLNPLGFLWELLLWGYQTSHVFYFLSFSECRNVKLSLQSIRFLFFFYCFLGCCSSNVTWTLKLPRIPPVTWVIHLKGESECLPIWNGH